MGQGSILMGRVPPAPRGPRATSASGARSSFTSIARRRLSLSKTVSNGGFTETLVLRLGKVRVHRERLLRPNLVASVSYYRNSVWITAGGKWILRFAWTPCHPGPGKHGPGFRWAEVIADPFYRDQRDSN